MSSEIRLLSMKVIMQIESCHPLPEDNARSSFLNPIGLPFVSIIKVYFLRQVIPIHTNQETEQHDADTIHQLISRLSTRATPQRSKH